MLAWLMVLGCTPAPDDTADRWADLDFPPAGPGEAPDPSAWGPFSVGVTTVWLTDPDRDGPDGGPRDYPVEIWYPTADTTGALKSYPIADFVPNERLELEGITAENLPMLRTSSYADAPPDRQHGPYPLVVFSHGNGGMRLQSMFYTEYLASHGYVVASPDHVGNTLKDFLMPDAGSAFSAIAESFAYRPGDIERIVELLHGNDAVAPVSDGPWGMSGHSLGAWTALRAAAEMDDIGVTIAQAPPDIALALVGTGTDPDELGMPVFLQAGTLDRILDYEKNAVTTFTALAPPALMASYHGAGHFTFSDLCTLDLGPVEDMIYDSLGNVLEDGCGPKNPASEEIYPLLRFHAIGLINGVLRDSPESTEQMLAGPETANASLFTMEGSLEAPQ